MTIRNLDALFAPRSVVLFGASAREPSIGSTVRKNLFSGGFSGSIELVNPKYSEIEGHPCHHHIHELPSPVDLALIATPPATIPGIIAELVKQGTKAAAVLTAGLNARQRQEMLDAARPGLLRILGPNIIGLMLPHVHLNASFVHRDAPAGQLALVSQSGALITAIVDWAASRSVGFSHVVSLGDMADVDFGDVLDYLAGDIHSHAILLYMEAVTNAAKFMSAARRAARVKPVIVFKSGRHASAAAAAASHTGRMAGADGAYDAAFRRAGLVRVQDLNELFEAAELLSRQPRLRGERLTILTNGGGAGVLAADRLADFGGTLAPLSDHTRLALDLVLPANWSRANPIDIIGDADAQRYGKALDIVLADPAVEVLLTIYCPTAIDSGLKVAETLVDRLQLANADGRGRVVLTNWLGDEAARASRAHFAAHGLPSFATPGAAARAFTHLMRYQHGQEAIMRTPTQTTLPASASGTAARYFIDQARREGRTMLNEPESKALIASTGIPIVDSQLAVDVEEAGTLARRLFEQHSCLVLKILSRDISHKSDVDGVRLDLASVEAVQQAAQAMIKRVRELRPQARIDGFILQPMLRRPDAHELILGMSVDLNFGPLILFGAGGTATEIIRDTALALPPIDHDSALELIGQTRIARLLAGYRDKPAADFTAIAKALVALSNLIAGHDAIREIDINPLLASAHGVMALDARVRIASDGEDVRVPMVIKPYPVRWEKRLLIDGIGGVQLRPILPEDEKLYEDFLAGISPEDHRLRFFVPKTTLSHRFVARLTQIDYAREMAFIALNMESQRLIGVVRFGADPDFRRGEYAVLVRSDLKGKGLGWQLMSHLIDYAQAQGLEELFGSVLTENSTMLNMCRQFGFAIQTDHDDPMLRHVTLKLNER